MTLTRLVHTLHLTPIRFSLVSVSLVCFGLGMGMNVVFAEPLKVVSYNVENLFHPKHDTVCIDSTTFIEKDDYEWTPEGERRWSYTRYYRKVENIARVLTNIGEWDGVDIVGLQEVENAMVVKRLCYTLRRGEYDFVHYESPDRRGIDVALIYKKGRVDTIATRAIKVKGERVNGERLITRDILYVCAQIDKRDTVHFFVCHLPSQRGGKAESEWKRKIAKEVLQSAIDSVYLAFRNPKIIVMGDFNKDALSNSPMQGEGKELRGINYQEPVNGKEIGTHKYQGRWTCLDHFYTSPSLDSLSRAEIYNAAWIQEPDEKYLDLKPKRTYNGFRYQKDGFSDHLPIVLTVSL